MSAGCHVVMSAGSHVRRSSCRHVLRSLCPQVVGGGQRWVLVSPAASVDITTGAGPGWSTLEGTGQRMWTSKIGHFIVYDTSVCFMEYHMHLDAGMARQN